MFSHWGTVYDCDRDRRMDNWMDRISIAYTLLTCSALCDKNPTCTPITSSLHHSIDFAFNLQLRMFSLHTFQFNGHFLGIGNISTYNSTLQVSALASQQQLKMFQISQSSGN